MDVGWRLIEQLMMESRADNQSRHVLSVKAISYLIQPLDCGFRGSGIEVLVK